MIEVSTSSEGFDRLEQAPISRNLQRALQRGLANWAADRTGLGGRLSASAWGLYGWTPRSVSYQKRQARGQWGVLPYVSPPRKQGYRGIGKFLFALTKPGIGHNVYAGPLTDREASAELTVAAARGLNTSRNAGRYLEEWGRLYPADVAGIDPRLAQLGDQALQKAITDG